MSTRLRKIERVTFVPGTPGTPAFAGRTFCPPPAPFNGATYLNCALIEGSSGESYVRRGLPNDAATIASFGGLRPNFYNFFWLPGCVYGVSFASFACEPSSAPRSTGCPLPPGISPGSVGGIECPPDGTRCRPTGTGTAFFQVTDEFGRRVPVPRPSPAPSRFTRIPTLPPPPVQPVVVPAGATDLGNGCYAFPPRPAEPGTPPSYRVEVKQEWDAGAHSQVSHPADCRLTFTVSDSIGVVCGLTAASTPAGVEVDRVEHGFIVSKNNGVPSVRVIERGQVVTGFFPVAIGEVLQVTRRGEQVFYNVASAGQVHVSERPSKGPVKVAASLYALGDSVG